MSDPESNFFEDDQELEEELQKKKRQRSPQEKKAISYEKDRVLVGEYPHAFRKQLPRKKARFNRSYQRRVHLALAEAQMKPAGDHLEDLHPETERRQKVHVWGNPKLKQIVQWRANNRARHMLTNFLNIPYNSQSHRQHFIEFLNPQLKSRKAFAHQLSLLINELLLPPEIKVADIDSNWNRITERKGKDWIKNFLEDEPEWEEWLRKWISSFEG